ncbi:hypothetical protein [Acetivibrio saccincola]|nr:hypothetical protein [Acetivibrio saccincola]NLW26252.1 hypothetical protein [Acetivibrio saccincola]HQD29883.1 hypothetical protein [Acetivibrio saccincola]
MILKRGFYMKKAIIIILAILLAVFIGIILPILINNGASGSPDVNNSEGEVDIIESGEPDDIPGGPGSVQNSADLDTDAPEDTSVNNSENSSENDPAPTDKQTNAPGGDNNGADEEGNNDSDAENKILSESWVEEMIREYGHHISDDDLEDLRRLYSKVDIAYLQGIMEDGYTDEEVEEVKEYLKATLGSDYLRGRELFYKYSYLMAEIEI